MVKQKDVTLGEFLEEFCFNPSHRCKVRDCNRDMIEHERTFLHGNGRLNISVCKADAQVFF
jgi:1-phosphatidylinositol-3-phosphate 5-kinase